MSSYHTGFGNGFNNSSPGDFGCQASESQGQWQFNGMVGNGADARQNTFGPQGTQVRLDRIYSIAMSC